MDAPFFHSVSIHFCAPNSSRDIHRIIYVSFWLLKNLIILALIQSIKEIAVKTTVNGMSDFSNYFLRFRIASSVSFPLYRDYISEY